jgi:hypothetical protein
MFCRLASVEIMMAVAIAIAEHEQYRHFDRVGLIELYTLRLERLMT